MSWRSVARHAVDGFDSAVRRASRRRVLVYVRTAMHAAVLDPIARVLERDGRVDVRYLAERPDDAPRIDAACGRALRWTPRWRARWRRVDLFVTADPWGPPTLYRCRRRVNFFHGVAGKYDLDSPGHLPAGFEQYDRVAFVNADRMGRYLDQGIVTREAAVLVGFPKIDDLVNGRYDAAAVRDRLGLERHRPTAIYAPTWSPASSLNLAGEAIVASLVDAGWNIILKPHARSLDPDEKYSGGIDWRQRLHAIEVPGRVVLREDGDASPLLAASDLMVTDHSSIGFEFCLLDRPLIVFDTPELVQVARINPERVEALRNAARVVVDAAAVGPAANEEIAAPGRRRASRRAAAQPLFHEPGDATSRALSVVYDLLNLPAHGLRDTEAPRPARVGVTAP
jgi:hypothetical protein